MTWQRVRRVAGQRDGGLGGLVVALALILTGCSGTPQVSPTASAEVPVASPAVMPSPTPTAAPATPTISPNPNPSPGPGANPVRIAEGQYLEPQLVVDTSGASHVVAALDRNDDGDADRVFYFTNRSGSWTRERLTNDRGRYSIAVDADDSVWIAFERDDGIYLWTDGSAPVKFIDNPQTSVARNPSLVVRNGSIHLAYVAYTLAGSSPTGIVRYATDSTGQLSDEEIGTGESASIQVAADGTPFVLYYDPEVGVPLQFAIGTSATGSFTVQGGPQSGDIDIDGSPRLTIDDRGVLHATWHGRLSSDFYPPTTIFYARFDGQWSTPENVGGLTSDVYWHGMALDSSHAVHIVASYFENRWASVYATNRGGELVAQPLSAGDDGIWQTAIAVDALGEPHFVYSRHDIESGDGDPVTSGHELLHRVGLGD